MRAATLLITSLCACGSGDQSHPVVERHPSVERPTADAPNDFAVLSDGPWVRVSVERGAYRSESSSRFFVRVRIDNLTERELGVDLRDRDQSLYPNQWGGLMQPHRVDIDERRVVPIDLTPEMESTLRRDFQRRELTFIEGGGRAEYYVDFNASDAADLLALEEPYMYISMAGQFFVTDGSNARSITLDGDAAANANVATEELIFVPPSRLPQIPNGAHIAGDD